MMGDAEGEEPIRVQDVMVPSLGVAVTEVTLSTWLKNVGDAVSAGDAICEVESEKAMAEVEAPVSGRIVETIVGPGETVSVGSLIARIATSAAPSRDVATGESIAPAASPGQPEVVSVATEPAPVSSELGARTLSTPYARHLARQLGVEVTQVAQDRGVPVRARDILATVLDSQPATERLRASGYGELPHRDEELNRVRSVMAERMALSISEIAHMTMQVDVDMSTVAAVRERWSQDVPTRRITPLTLVAVAAVRWLEQHPRLNATLIGRQVLRHWAVINLGIAVDTTDGLVVPVVADAGALGVEEMAGAITELAEAARARRLRPAHTAAPTFTVSNPGVFGAVEAPAIIGVPQVATLGMGAIVHKPVADPSDQGRSSVVVRPIMRLALTYDHRALDGGDVGRFLSDLRKALESWTQADYARRAD